MSDWITRQTVFQCSRCKHAETRRDDSQPEGWFAYQAVTPPLASFEDSPRVVVCRKCAERFRAFMERQRKPTAASQARMPRVERTALDNGDS